MERHLAHPPTVFWHRHIARWKEFEPGSNAYVIREYCERRPAFGAREPGDPDEFLGSIIDSTNVIFNQILFTLLTWSDRPLSGADILRALGHKNNASYQSSVSSTLQSGVLKNAYIKYGSKKNSRFVANISEANKNYMSRFRFIPSERAIAIARQRADKWRLAREQGLPLD
ncbi:MAG: hypothetical protein GYB26_10130 [Gammaproteobacteria bacterium]|nr:hypothetical protein [Gammaproteobacteria bacterium]